MIKNENDLLGLLIENKNLDNSCNHIVLLNKSHLDIDSYSMLCKNLISKGYITQDLDQQSFFLQSAFNTPRTLSK